MTDTGIEFRPKLQLLSSAQTKRMHSATLELLERTGVRVTQPKALELLHAAGARIDGTRVRMPSFLVEGALRKAPSRILWGGRNGETDLSFGDDDYWFGMGLDCPEYLDPLTDERRPLVSADVRVMSTLANALPNLAWGLTAGLSADVPPEIADRSSVKQALTYCKKPVMSVCRDVNSLQDIYEMGMLVAGSADRFAKAPNLIHYSEPISPLLHGDDALEKLLFCAEKGIPIVYYPAPMAGGTSPATFAGTVVQASAESLSGLVILQLARPGAPFIYGALATVMDMRTTIFSYGACEMSLMVAGLTELAHHYHLPFYGTAGCSDAKFPDQQAATEITFSCLSSALMGSNLIHDAGFLDHSNLLSPAAIVLENEILYMVKQYLRGLPVSDETLALDLVDTIGPGGTFLTEVHTLKHFRETWYSQLFDRTMSGQWIERGGRDFNQRLQDLTATALAQPMEPLPDEMRREMDRMSEHWK
jgi:trimethylamine---corrinoid protein Co-methyltransferase